MLCAFLFILNVIMLKMNKIKQKVLKEIEKTWNNETQIGYSDLAMQEAINLAIKYRNAEARKEFEKLQRWNLCLLGGKPAMKKAKKGYFIDYYELLNKIGGEDD